MSTYSSNPGIEPGPPPNSMYMYALKIGGGGGEKKAYICIKLVDHVKIIKIVE
jgi:hypothetical protein